MEKPPGNRAAPRETYAVGWLVWLLCLFLCAGGCCRRAPRSLVLASSELEAARKGCAERFSPRVLEEADRAMELARSELEGGHCREADRSADRALELAQRARAEAQAVIQASRKALAELFPRVRAQLREALESSLAELVQNGLRSAQELLADAERQQETPCEIPAALKSVRRARLELRDALEEARTIRLHRERIERAELDHMREVESQRHAGLQRQIHLLDRYTVRPGDTLHSIASLPEVYGEGSRWRELYEYNRDCIADPDLLYTGQELLIPREEESP